MNLHSLNLKQEVNNLRKQISNLETENKLLKIDVISEPDKVNSSMQFDEYSQNDEALNE